MRVLALLIGVLLAGPLAAQPNRWLATWAPSPFSTAPRPRADSVDRVPTFADRTLRQIVRTTIGGTRLRIRFSNEFGDQPLVIGAARVALCDSGATIRAGTGKVITFGGKTSISIGRSGIVTSDPIDMTVPALSDLAVSMWVADSARASTRHALGLQKNYVSSRGDFTNATSMPVDTTLQQWTWLAGVDVVNPKANGVIVAFGNSITDGYASSVDSNSRWPDVLARRLQASKEPLRAVVNAGISGNGVLSQITGPSALARFDRDVLMQPGVTHVILLEGINDLNRGTMPASLRDSVSVEDIIFGYQQLIARAHERGVVIFGATLTPMGNMGRPNSLAVNAKRKAVNEWIRTSGMFDGVIDFDAATRDPAHPDQFLPAFDAGDHLHPNNAGFRAMGEAVDLVLFRRRAARR